MRGQGKAYKRGIFPWNRRILAEEEDRRGVPEAQECTPQEGEKEILQGVEAEEWMGPIWDPRGGEGDGVNSGMCRIVYHVLRRNGSANAARHSTLELLWISGATTHTIPASHSEGIGERKRGRTTCSHFRQWVQNNASVKRGNEGKEIRRGNSDGVFAETSGESCQNCSSERSLYNEDTFWMWRGHQASGDVEVHERCRIPTGNHTKCGSIRRCYEEDSSVRGDCEREA